MIVTTRRRRLRHRQPLVIIATVAAWYAAGALAPLRAGQPLAHVLVLNMHAGKDVAGKDNLERIVDLVRSTGADLVLLQEVDRGTNRSGKVDQLQTLMDSTRYAGVFGRTLDYDGGTYGIAALARRGIGSSTTVALPVTPEQTRAGGSHEPRGALVLVATTERGTLQAITTHLDASKEEVYRLQEAAHLLQVRARLGLQVPLLVGGDFNAEPSSAVVQRLTASSLRDAWAECGKGEGLTYPADAPRKRIDYLFLGGDLGCTEARVIETTISDHRPLLVIVSSRGKM